jgi:hypothetical protein
MIGIRYVITEAASIPGARLVYEQMAGDTPLRLFRVEHPNLGQYSPMRTTRIATAAQALAAMKDKAFDAEQQALVEDDPPDDLVPGQLRSLMIDAGPTIRVDADSAGKSLLVLPFEFSYCLRLEQDDGGSARLIPVNLQQTGLLFDRQAKVRISYHFGPLDQVGCRGEDLERADRLRLHEAM